VRTAADCHNSFAAAHAIADEPADAPLLRQHAFKNGSLRGAAPPSTRRVMTRAVWGRPEFVAVNRSSTAVWAGGFARCHLIAVLAGQPWRPYAPIVFVVALAVLSRSLARTHLARLPGCPVTAWPPSGYRHRRCSCSLAVWTSRSGSLRPESSLSHCAVAVAQRVRIRPGGWRRLRDAAELLGM
jgi:hypothetical protein